MKTINVPEPYRRWLPLIRQFLRREIPPLGPVALPPRYWSLQITGTELRLQATSPDGPIESSRHVITLDPAIARQVASFLAGKPIDIGTAQLRLHTPASLLSCTEHNHQGTRLSLPECWAIVPGMPDPLVTAIEDTASGLVLHCRFPITRVSFTVDLV